MKPFLRLATVLLLALLAAAPAAAAGKRKQARQLEQVQTSLATAIRWGEFEQAWGLVDPAYREANPLTDLALARYQQVQVTGYRDLDLDGLEDDGSVVRTIELRVVNRHTQAERTVRYRERWRWDQGDRRWWLVGGLPDLWAGE